MGIQSILFERSHFDVAKAVAWLMKHHHAYYKVDIKPHVLRFRQYDPIPGKRYFMKVLEGPNEGVMFVIDY